MCESTSSETRYIAIKIDVVASRRVQDRAGLQERLFRVADLCNKMFERAIASRFIVTHGDEAQGMLYHHGADRLFTCLEQWVSIVRPLQMRFGVGIGPLNTPKQAEAVGMDGPCWHDAQIALDLARKQRRVFHMKGLSPDDDQHLSALANLLFAIAKGWTDKQAEAVQLHQEHPTQIEAARRMGVTPATFSKHLSLAHWAEYREGRDTFTSMLRQLIS